MTEDLVLRPARADEFEYVFALHKEGLGGYIESAWGWDEAGQRRDLRAGFDAGNFEVAVRGGRPVGMISLSTQADHLYLNDIIVAPDRRGGGIGTALMRMVLARARERGVALRLSVFHTNPARALYQRLGFRITAEDEHRAWMETR
jgi:ribosomal protein S18 acetylase RimI-like enzyme